MPDGFKNSHFSWNELMTNDIEKAKTLGQWWICQWRVDNTPWPKKGMNALPA